MSGIKVTRIATAGQELAGGSTLDATYAGTDVDVTTGLPLDNLLNVNAPAPDDQDVLTWDDGAGEWIAAPGGGAALTVADEGTPLATAATTLDFVGAGVVASGTGATKTITIASASGIAESLLDAKGDLIVASANDTAARLAVGGTNGHVLTVNSGATLGVEWAAASGSGSDLVQVASGAGSIIIPGLSASPDIRVAGTGDDEFDTTDTSDPMTGWTTLGTPTAHDINSTVKSHYYVSKSNGTVSLTGIYQAWSPSAGNVVTCKITGFTGWDANSQTRGGLFVAEASPGKIMSIARGGGVAGIITTIWTNPTTYSSNPTTTTMYGTTAWFRIRYNSSTSLDFEYSLDGLFWWKQTTAYNPSMTVGAVGLFIVPNNTAGTVLAAFDWIRFT